MKKGYDPYYELAKKWGIPRNQAKLICYQVTLGILKDDQKLAEATECLDLANKIRNRE